VIEVKHSRFAMIYPDDSVIAVDHFFAPSVLVED
jgi:hypothetical protein